MYYHKNSQRPSCYQLQSPPSFNSRDTKTWNSIGFEASDDMAPTIVDPPRTALASLFSDKFVFPSSEKPASAYVPTSAMTVVFATIAPSPDDV